MAYNPSVPPQLSEDLLPFIQDEFLRVAQAFNDSTDGQMGIRHKMPLRYKPGTVLYLSGGPEADPLGTGKEGLYRYTQAKTWEYVGGEGGTGPGPGGDVTSVNGKTGVVVLTADDVNAEKKGEALIQVKVHKQEADPHPQYLKSGDFATVASTGQYNDLLGKPALFSGSYNDLANKPALFSGKYADLTGKPSVFPTEWALVAGKPDMNLYQPKSDMANYQPRSEMTGYVARWEMGDYALLANVYGKTESDGRYALKGTSYTIAETDSYFAAKAEFNTFRTRAESASYLKPLSETGVGGNLPSWFRSYADDANPTVGGGVTLREVPGFDSYAAKWRPKITFHWGGVYSKNLEMTHLGDLYWGGADIGFNRDWLQFQYVASWDLGIQRGFSAKYLSNPGIAGVPDGALISNSHSADWSHQLFCDWRTGDMYTSFKAGGVRGATRKVVFEDTLGPLLSQVAQMQTTINQMAVKIQQMEAWVAAHS